MEREGEREGGSEAGREEERKRRREGGDLFCFNLLVLPNQLSS